MGTRPEKWEHQKVDHIGTPEELFELVHSLRAPLGGEIIVATPMYTITSNIVTTIDPHFTINPEPEKPPA